MTELSEMKVYYDTNREEPVQVERVTEGGSIQIDGKKYIVDEGDRILTYTASDETDVLEEVPDELVEKEPDTQTLETEIKTAQDMVSTASEGGTSDDALFALYGELGDLSDFYPYYKNESWGEDIELDETKVLGAHVARIFITLLKFAEETGVDLEMAFNNEYQEWTQTEAELMGKENE